MAQDTENRIDGRYRVCIETATLEQTADCHRWNWKFSFNRCSDYRIWYKEKNQITAGVFPYFSRESRLDDGVFGNPNSYYWYLIYTGSKNHKKTACAFAGRLHHTGRVADGHRIHCDSGTALNGHHRTTGKKSTDVFVKKRVGKDNHADRTALKNCCSVNNEKI